MSYARSHPNGADQGATISPEEVADRLGYSRKRIYQFLEAKQIPGLKIGKKWIINRREFDDWLAHRGAITPAAGVAGPSPDIPQMLTQLDNVRELLRQFSAVVEGAISVGIEDILPPRRDGSRTRAAIEAELDRAHGDVLISGTTLRDFFSDKDYELTLHKKIVRNEEFRVRAVMLDPLSELAHARAFAERGSPMLSESDFRLTNLFADTQKSINRILLLQQEKTKRNASRFELSVRFVPHSTLWAVCTENVAFVEFYHFGRPAPDAWFTGSCLGETVPVLRVRARTALYNIVRSHIEYLYDGVNPYIPAVDVTTVAERLLPPGVNVGVASGA
jgi:excisionase family DNA binding protein